MKYIPITLAFVLLSNIYTGQTRTLIVPQFDFLQIDSLVNAETKKHATDSNFVMVGVDWSVGAWMISKDTGFAACENPFDIYILYSQQNNYLLQHIDNFGYFTPKAVNADEIKAYLHEKFALIKSEKITPSDGGSEHDFVQILNVYYLKDSVDIKISASEARMKSNRRTSRYQLLRLFDKLHKKHKALSETRISVKKEKIE